MSVQTALNNYVGKSRHINSRIIPNMDQETLRTYVLWYLEPEEMVLSIYVTLFSKNIYCQFDSLKLVDDS